MHAIHYYENGQNVLPHKTFRAIQHALNTILYPVAWADESVDADNNYIVYIPGSSIYFPEVYISGKREFVPRKQLTSIEI